MYTIGEFSKITGLTVKALRFYDEQGLLRPSAVDPGSGYRYDDDARAERARVIVRLRAMQFPVRDIAAMLEEHHDEGDILEHLQQHRQRISERLRQYQGIIASLDTIITTEREATAAMQSTSFEVAEKSLESIRIAGIRMRGRYEECGGAFAQIGRKLGRYICGKPLLLHFDDEYKEQDADFEACLPVRSGAKEVDGIAIRELPGGRCVSLLHKGPYTELGRSYARILQYARQQGYTIAMPTREVYVKGPGMIFRGNPKRYLTEIQMLVASP